MVVRAVAECAVLLRHVEAVDILVAVVVGFFHHCVKRFLQRLQSVAESHATGEHHDSCFRIISAQALDEVAIGHRQAFAVNDCDVFSSTGTIENPERLSGAFVFGSASGAFDWYISMAAAIDGGIGMDNIYSDIMGNSYMYSQMYDLTGSNGKATFEFTLASPDATTAVVSIAKLLDNNRLQPIESFDIEVTKEMTKHTVEFTKGTDYLIFDDFKLTMDLQAEKSIEIGITNALLQDPNATSAEFTRIDFNNDRISYDVLAAMVYPTLSSPLVSELSNRIEVEDISSVENTENVSASAYVEGGVLYVENPNAEKVEVYNLSGVRIFADNSGAYKVNTNLDANGVYIVRVGDKAIKVVR